MNIMTPPEALRPIPSMTPLTLADICQSIAGDEGLGKARKSNLRSAITCFCRACTPPHCRVANTDVMTAREAAEHMKVKAFPKR